MISCFYREQEIVILDYLNNYGFAGIESLIKASKNKELICKEPDCRLPLQFVNSEKRIKHFRHFRGTGENCFFRNNSQSEDIIEVQSKLYTYFSNLKGISVTTDAKLAGNYTNLILKNEEEIVFVINIMKRTLPVAKWISMHDEYKKQNIKDIWINISEQSSKQKSIMMYSLDQYQIERGSDNIAIYYDPYNDAIIFKIKYEINKGKLKYPYISYPDIITESIPFNYFLSDGDYFSGEQIEICREEMIRKFELEVLESQAKEERAILQAEELRKKEEEVRAKRTENIDKDLSELDVSIYKYKEDQQSNHQYDTTYDDDVQRLYEQKFEKATVEELYLNLFEDTAVCEFDRKVAAMQIVTCIDKIMEGQDIYIEVLKTALFGNKNWIKYLDLFKDQREKARKSGNTDRYATYCRVSS